MKGAAMKAYYGLHFIVKNYEKLASDLDSKTWFSFQAFFLQTAFSIKKQVFIMFVDKSLNREGGTFFWLSISFKGCVSSSKLEAKSTILVHRWLKSF